MQESLMKSWNFPTRFRSWWSFSGGIQAIPTQVSPMDVQDLTYIVLALLGLGCVCQVLLCIFVIYLHVNLKKVYNKIEDVRQIQIEFNNRRTTSGSLRLRDMLPIRASARPTAGESITLLPRNPHPPLPEEFVNTEVHAGEKNSSKDAETEKKNLGSQNEGFKAEWTRRRNDKKFNIEWKTWKRVPHRLIKLILWSGSQKLTMAGYVDWSGNAFVVWKVDCQGTSIVHASIISCKTTTALGCMNYKHVFGNSRCTTTK